MQKHQGLWDAIDDDEYSGGLVSLFQDGLRFIMRNNRKAWRKAATRRIEYPDYPERAITEGLVNALIHRDYLMVGSEVHIDIFDDRLEIYSPGGMMDGSTLEGRDLRNISSQRRNPVLADIFSRLQLMERRGSGFKKILEDYDFQENAREDLTPKFMAANKDFLLTLYNLNYFAGQNVGESSVNGDEIPVHILELIKNNNYITIPQIAQKFTVTKRTIERHIKLLKEQGLLIRHGAARGGYWEIVDKLEQ